ncbi:hypothetical protein HLH33_02990 [Gluconacetobacter diazotrophicus]|uniref:Uncharacterized protein n=1 Tax=Gluconacetobacter diazotrophicus TaxID=33996 RepID=A0A7W4I3P0_GLUDI|nr:hypothetical protein [Gluconacetobacter diazotrophicus]MBB2155283.1 hypothetical protein [Gluconacetobacter diazotrophicus]
MNENMKEGIVTAQGIALSNRAALEAVIFYIAKSNTDSQKVLAQLHEIACARIEQTSESKRDEATDAARWMTDGLFSRVSRGIKDSE